MQGAPPKELTLLSISHEHLTATPSQTTTLVTIMRITNRMHRRWCLIIDPEPPPLSETIPQHHTIAEQQWVEDAIYSANLNINCIQETNILTQDENGYSPFIRKLQNKVQYEIHLLRARHHGTILLPPNVHPIHIPTPKCHILMHVLHDTTWKDDCTRD